ncbi:MAG UNVERIFIED_CONTAM: hypothetical protein LVR18_03445 [Planctomycetaceae bacterium]
MTKQSIYPQALWIVSLYYGRLAMTLAQSILFLAFLFCIYQAEANPPPTPTEEEVKEYEPFINKGAIPLPIAPEVMESREKPPILKLKNPIIKDEKPKTPIEVKQEPLKEIPIQVEKQQPNNKIVSDIPPLPLIEKMRIKSKRWIYHLCL